MKSLMDQVILFWQGSKHPLGDQKGQTMVEYALVLALIVVVVAGVYYMSDITGKITETLTSVKGAFTPPVK